MAFDSSTAESSKSQTIKIVLAAVSLLTAVVVLVVYLMGGGNTGTANDASSSPYVCLADGEVLNVTPAIYEQMRKAGDVGGREGVAGRSIGVYLRCPKCKKTLMVAGVRCPKDNTPFAPIDLEGKPGVCPKCGAKPPGRSDQPAS